MISADRPSRAPLHLNTVARHGVVKAWQAYPTPCLWQATWRPWQPGRNITASCRPSLQGEGRGEEAWKGKTVAATQARGGRGDKKHTHCRVLHATLNVTFAGCLGSICMHNVEFWYMCECVCVCVRVCVLFLCFFLTVSVWASSFKKNQRNVHEPEREIPTSMDLSSGGDHFPHSAEAAGYITACNRHVTQSVNSTNQAAYSQPISYQSVRI